MMTNNGVGSISSKTIKLSYDHELIATCYHEAGHTLSGLLNFMVIPSVSIEMTKDRKNTTNLGFTHYESAIAYEDVKDYDLFLNLVTAEIHINYAGLAAEKLFYKDTCGTDQLPMALKHGSYLDRDHVSEIIKKNNLAPAGRKRHLFKKKSLNDCMRVLDQSWVDVKIITHELYKRRKLYHHDLSELLIRKSPNRAFWKKQFKLINVLHNSKEDLDEKEIKIIITR